MRKFAHDTVGAQKNAVRAEDNWAFQPGDSIIADGFPGKVESVEDGPFLGNEIYQVVLDNGIGGGQYTASQLAPGASLQSEAIGLDFWKFKSGDRVMADGYLGYVSYVVQDSVKFGGTQTYEVVLDKGLGSGQFTAAQLTKVSSADELDPVEATSTMLASHWYPELGTILRDRLPNERLQITAGLQRTAVTDSFGKEIWTQHPDAAQAYDEWNSAGYESHEVTPEMLGEMINRIQADRAKKSTPKEAARKYPNGHINGIEITDHEYPGESGVVRCQNCDKYHSATYDHEGRFGEGRIHAVVCPEDHLTDYYTDHALEQRPQYPAKGSVKPFTLGAAAPSSNDSSNGPVDDQGAVPDVCSFCGNPGPWTDEQDTGRGTRIRCGTCGGTMRLNSDEDAGTSGIQWQPEFPNSPQNAASRRGDPRATINDLSAVHSSFNAPASQEAGYAIFHAPELVAQIKHQVQATLAAGVDDDWRFQFTATWFDVQKKAKRIRDEDGVRILGATVEGVIGEIRGDTAIYESAINYVPGTHKVAAWTCGCKWGAYSWGRSPAYRRFEGRQCSHVLALQYEASSRGIFGRTVTPDPDRMDGQYQRTPVQVQYERPSERHPEGRDIRRRTVPPGNMRRTFSSLNSEPSAMFEWAQMLTALGTPPSQVVDTLHQLTVPHYLARAAVKWATTSTDSATVEVDGERHVAVAIENDSVYLDDGRLVSTASVRMPTAKEETATAYPGGGQASPGSDIPGIEDRDQTERKKQRKHLLHHTNDAREHAHNFGYGLPWGGSYVWCDQCNGSGCGHCGGTGQVATGQGLAQNPSDLSSTESPVADQSVDAGSMIGDSGGGMSATGVVSRVHLQAKGGPIGDALCGAVPDADHPNYRLATVVCEACAALAPLVGEVEERRMLHEASWHTADYSAGDLGPGYPAQGDRQKTPTSNSPNPGSTGFATSADPNAWVNPMINDGFNASWSASLRVTASGDTSKPPVAAGVALKAADTGRVLMIQRSNKDEKDPARGRWEFPGGHREDGDTTSLHAAIREFEEEVGQKFPEGGHVTHVHRAGPYVLHTVVVPKEDEAVDFTNGRSTVNPDDPDGDDHEQSAWWDPEHARKNPALRDEAKSNPWGDIKKAAGGHNPRNLNQIEYSYGIGAQHGYQWASSLLGGAHEESAQSAGQRAAEAHEAGGNPAMKYHYLDGWHDGVDQYRQRRSATLGNGSVTMPDSVGGNPPERTYKPVGRTTEARFLTFDEVRARAREEELRTGKSAEQLLREHVAWQESHFATLHDEPEGALPSTDGAADEDEDDDVATALGYGGTEEPIPGVPVEREAPWGYPESAADHPDPAVAQPGSADVTPSPSADSSSAVLQSESNLSVEAQLAAQANPIIAAFQQTAAFQQMAASVGQSDAPDSTTEQSGGVADGQPPSNADIAAAARAALAKLGAKNFSFAEQQELIGEGGGRTRPRNTDVMRVEGTHYERLGDEPVEDEWVML